MTYFYNNFSTKILQAFTDSLFFNDNFINSYIKLKISFKKNVHMVNKNLKVIFAGTTVVSENCVSSSRIRNYSVSARDGEV